MTPTEWLDKELTELELSRKEASVKLGYHYDWLQKQTRKETWNEWRALAIVTDLRLLIQKKPPIFAYKKLQRKRKVEIARKRAREARQRRRAMEYDATLWY